MRVERKPRGPSTSAVRGGGVLEVRIRRLEGSKSFKFTPRGSNKGAAPIRDSHFGVVENDRKVVLVAEENAGTRKSGGGRVVFESDLRLCIEMPGAIANSSLLRDFGDN